LDSQIIVNNLTFMDLEKAIKEMRNKKATGDDDVPGDVLK